MAELPYDGKPCPFCPMEVRNLFAVAYNYVNCVRRGGCSTTLEDLKQAVDMCQPLADAHFADPRHSHG